MFIPSITMKRAAIVGIALFAFAHSAFAAPVITKVSPDSLPGGESATITGSGFTQNSIVLFGNYPVTPDSITPTSIKFSTTLSMTCGSPYYVQIKQQDTEEVSNQYLVQFVTPLPVDPPEIRLGVTPYNKLPPGYHMVLYGPNTSFGCGQGSRPNFAPGVKVIFDGNTSSQITPEIPSTLSIEFDLPATLSLGNHYLQVQYNGHLSNKFSFNIADHTVPTPVLKGLTIWAGPEKNPTETYNSDNVQLDTVYVDADNIVSSEYANTGVLLNGKLVSSSGFSSGEGGKMVLWFSVPSTVAPGTYAVSLYNYDQNYPFDLTKGKESNTKTLKVNSAANRPGYISGAGPNLGGWTYVPIEYKEGVSIRLDGLVFKDSTAIIDGKVVPSTWMDYWGGLLDVPIPTWLGEGTHTAQLGSKDGNRKLSNIATFEAKKVAGGGGGVPPVEQVPLINSFKQYVKPGEVVKVLGTNFNPSIKGYLYDVLGKKVIVPLSSITEFSMNATIPATVLPGSYSMNFTYTNTSGATESLGGFGVNVLSATDPGVDTKEPSTTIAPTIDKVMFAKILPSGNAGEFVDTKTLSVACDEQYAIKLFVNGKKDIPNDAKVLLDGSFYGTTGTLINDTYAGTTNPPYSTILTYIGFPQSINKEGTHSLTVSVGTAGKVLSNVWPFTVAAAPGKKITCTQVSDLVDPVNSNTDRSGPGSILVPGGIVSPSPKTPFSSATGNTALQTKIAEMKARLLAERGIVEKKGGVTPLPTAAVPVDSSKSCTTLTKNLSYKSTDAKTEGQVTLLQKYLAGDGYLATAPTGYFGSATLKATKAFQRTEGINPTGYVGPQTRAKIQALSCE